MRYHTHGNSNPDRTGYQRTPRVPGPLLGEERPLQYRFIALPIIGTLAYLLLVSEWLA